MARSQHFCHSGQADLSGDGRPNAEGDKAQLDHFCRRWATPENDPAIPVLLTSPTGRTTLQEEHFTQIEWEPTTIYNEVGRPASVHASRDEVP